MTTRAALLTPPGVSAIATIQIAGPQSLNLLQNIFRPYKAENPVSFSCEKLHYGTLYENEEILDAVIVATDPVKQTVDIHCHGGPRIVQRILLLLQTQDVEITPARQLSPAESIADEVVRTLPLAKTRLGVLAIAAQHPGGLTKGLQAEIDTLQNEKEILGRVLERFTKLLPTFQIAQRLLNPPAVVLAGAVNVGKSTLANALTGRRQSITAELPGTTRDWTAQLVDINGLPVNLIDTPGRRDAGDMTSGRERGDTVEENGGGLGSRPNEDIERQALRLAAGQIDQADLLVLVIEAGENEKRQIENQKKKLPSGKDILIVANKSDLSDRDGTAETASAHIESKNHLYVSALKETNLDRLRSAIAEHFGLADFDPQQPLIFTQRQYDVFSEILNDTPSIQAVIQRLQAEI